MIDKNYHDFFLFFNISYSSGNASLNFFPLIFTLSHFTSVPVWKAIPFKKLIFYHKDPLLHVLAAFYSSPP